MSETRSVTFSVYPDPDGPFAVMDSEDPQMPLGILSVIQEHVSDAVDAGRLTVDGPLEEAGVAEYSTGKEDGSVGSVTLDPELTE